MVISSLNLIEMSTSHIHKKNEHHPDVQAGTEVQEMWDKMGNSLRAERAVNMSSYIAGKDKLAAVRWFRSLLC